MTLWLVRHAQPLLESGTCYGQLDIPADRDATHACALVLSQRLPRHMRGTSSPLQRCAQLAQALYDLRPDLNIQPDPRLKEMHFGNWENRPWASLPKSELDDWTVSFADYAAGQAGESVSQLMARVAAVFDVLPHDADTLWITHAGVIRAAQLLARGVRTVKHVDQWPCDAPSYGQWCTLDLQA